MNASDDLLSTKPWAAEHIGDETEYTFQRKLLQAARSHYAAEAAQLVVPPFRRPARRLKLWQARAPVWQMAASWLLIGVAAAAFWPKPSSPVPPETKTVTLRVVDTLYLTHLVRDTLVQFITTAAPQHAEKPAALAPRVETVADARGFAYLAQPAQRGLSWADDSLPAGLVSTAIKD